jgi:glycine cleavage system H protein
MNYPENLQYTKDHEWAKVESSKVTVGITDHAQNALGDIVYIDLPKVGRELKKGETFGVVESIKAVSDLYAPISGKVVATNSELVQDPAVINRDAHGSWMVVIEPSVASELAELLDSKQYTQFVQTL